MFFGLILRKSETTRMTRTLGYYRISINFLGILREDMDKYKCALENMFSYDL